MKMKILAASVILLSAISLTTAQTNDSEINPASGPDPEPTPISATQNDSINLTQLKNTYNENTARVPEFLGSLIGDQNIAINLSNIENDQGMLEEDVIGIKTDGKNISDIQWGEYNETTLKIWINQEDVNQLMEADQPLQTLKEMLKNGDIRYETYTLANKVKMTIMQVFLLF